MSLSFPFFSSFYEEAILRKVKTILPACGAFTSCWDQLRIFHALYLLLYSWRAPAAKLLILPSVNLLPTSALVFSLSLRARSVALLITFTCIHLPKVQPLLFPRTVLSPCNASSSHCDNLRRRRGIHASLLKWSPPPSNLLRLAHSLPAFSLFFNFTLSIRLSFNNILSPPVLLNRRFSGCKTADAAPFSTCLSVSSQSVIFTSLHILNSLVFSILSNDNPACLLCVHKRLGSTANILRGSHVPLSKGNASKAKRLMQPVSQPSNSLHSSLFPLSSSVVSHPVCHLHQSTHLKSSAFPFSSRTIPPACDVLIGCWDKL